ncbi:Hypothetical_protein [Hexamita inflata]|uniref:Hypothetical_protein n=1 Tax=Hexamita inflata TaxID=28002 RepID=A0AA86QUP9_9EUKA|nr:Hypothetical protein HINF_LOCUS31839 [Hexamita inflata]CAI9949501.1 Hypothetical protein HINF_LOCUS37146 [Hexamita inflata]CAI9949506.1 Hypothetical protein HINF_LOCUS37151 [Hexamita inflata]CAI9963517.1 Hypothetical protein HINF_LOCUS51162 [Hexamita inflata]
MLSGLWIPTPDHEEPNVTQRLTPDQNTKALQKSQQGAERVLQPVESDAQLSAQRKSGSMERSSLQAVNGLDNFTRFKQTMTVSWVIAQWYFKFSFIQTCNSSVIFCAKVICIHLALSGPLLVDKF